MEAEAAELDRLRHRELLRRHQLALEARAKDREPKESSTNTDGKTEAKTAKLKKALNKTDETNGPRFVSQVTGPAATRGKLPHTALLVRIGVFKPRARFHAVSCLEADPGPEGLLPQWVSLVALRDFAVGSGARIFLHKQKKASWKPTKCT